MLNGIWPQLVYIQNSHNETGISKCPQNQNNVFHTCPPSGTPLVKLRGLGSSPALNCATPLLPPPQVIRPSHADYACPVGLFDTMGQLPLQLLPMVQGSHNRARHLSTFAQVSASPNDVPGIPSTGPSSYPCRQGSGDDWQELAEVASCAALCATPLFSATLCRPLPCIDQPFLGFRCPGTENREKHFF